MVKPARHRHRLPAGHVRGHLGVARGPEPHHGPADAPHPAPGARLDLASQPGLWAAGVDIVGISSLVTFLENTSPYRRAYREREYGSLAADREFLHEVSPLTRIDQLRAPLFIIHRANDPGWR